MTIIFDFERHPYNINCNRYIQIKLWAISSAPVVIQLKCDSKETKMDHIRSKKNYISIVYLATNMLPEKILL
jgi:hypothetical protein